MLRKIQKTKSQNQSKKRHGRNHFTNIKIPELKVCLRPEIFAVIFSHDHILLKEKVVLEIAAKRVFTLLLNLF